MTRAWIATVILAGLTCGCTATQNEQGTATPTEPRDATDWELLDIGSRVSMRGLSVASESVVWLSGREGRFFRTVDGGETWQRGQVPGMAEVDFRDVEGVDAGTAYLLSAGAQARIYRTTDGGQNWVEQYANDAPGVFFDGMAFWDPGHAIAFSDPVDGRFLILTTEDGGDHWEPLPPDRVPTPLDAEAGFAASGTNVSVHGEHVWIGTGVGAARVLHSADRGQTWTAQDTPMASGPGTGIFSLAFWDERHGVAVGGNFQSPDETDGNIALTIDGGLTWTPAETPPRGYRSCVTVVPGTNGPTLVAVGPTGTDFSMDGGRRWQPLSDEGFHSVAFAGTTLGWAAGDDGRVGRLTGYAFQPVP